MNISRIRKTVSRKNQRGFTLLEVLVALVLGVAILTAAITLQVQHRKGFRLSSNKLQMQTNAKFAFEIIGQSLRSAGSMGCKNSLVLKGDAVNPNNGCLGPVCISFNDPTVANANFWPGNEVLGYEYTGGGLVPAPPAAFSFVSNAYYNNDSDVLTVAGGYGEVYQLTENQDILPVDGSFQLDITNLSQVRLKQSQYGILSSCFGAKVFKVTSTNGEIAAGLIKWAGGSAADDNSTGQLGVESATSLGGRAISREFRRAAVVSYFVGMYPFNDNTGVPSLYQDVDGVPKRLIEGVEEIQILYGLSESPTARNIADRYVTADVIDSESSANDNKWEKVVSIRIGLIMRSTEEVYSSNQTQSVSLDCVGYTQTPKTDKYSRSAYCTEVSLRNRLVGTRTGNKV